jgi:toxin FitB
VSFLLDTNVISELARVAPNEAVMRWAAGLDVFAVSAITFDELVFGLTAKPNPRVQRWFESTVDNYCRVLDVTEAIARHAGALRGHHAKRGRVRAQPDMLIAATAAMHGLTLATRNERDFDGCGITLLNPFAR